MPSTLITSSNQLFSVLINDHVSPQSNAKCVVIDAKHSDTIESISKQFLTRINLTQLLDSKQVGIFFIHNGKILYPGETAGKTLEDCKIDDLPVLTAHVRKKT